jgi:hypothetical protein
MSSDQYKYVGASDARLTYGMTALGRLIDNVFCVQMDEFEHQLSHGWHKMNDREWVAMPPVNWGHPLPENGVIGTWNWCGGCRCVSFVFACCGWSSCGGHKPCEKCEGYQDWLAKQPVPDVLACPVVVA